ncbi:hypothetical protein AB0N06_23120 [Streptomyces sp. NPDC051020]|uniref:hypothetical protein n=1 Tax=Streptomyces sp. NPDC051020 TaxID=3155409 RepID=UPI0034137BE7
MRQLEAQAVDDALDLFAVLMANRLISPARRTSDRERLDVDFAPLREQGLTTAGLPPHIRTRFDSELSLVIVSAWQGFASARRNRRSSGSPLWHCSCSPNAASMP